VQEPSSFAWDEALAWQKLTFAVTRSSTRLRLCRRDDCEIALTQAIRSLHVEQIVVLTLRPNAEFPSGQKSKAQRLRRMACYHCELGTEPG
jgi:hypothetical protein